ncbi:MAG: NAD(P)/FAD-dependent oxidoreductase [Methanomicrobium sp.]|nr:NAD(P)/FAD-dependent oxidoreductase [Methanomicrobium sp.]
MITVVGGGPAGRFAAIYLAKAGKKVRLIEKRGSLGGQCLHQGCMVICGLNDCAKFLDESEKLQKLSVIDTAPKVNLPAVWSEMNKIQSVISKIIDKETEDFGISIVTGEAVIEGKTVFVDGRKLESESVLIATGSVPFMPKIPGNNLSGVYTPHTIMNLGELPKRIVIVGGGVISSEYSYIFSSFGSDVLIVSRSEFLRDKPEPFRKGVLKDLQSVKIREYTLLREIKGDESGKVTSVVLENGGSRYEVKCSAVLFAAGLIPGTEEISGLSIGSRGEIIIDENYETSVKGVFAAGDVTGRVFLTPFARMQGICAAKSILGEEIPKIPEYLPQSVKLFYEHSFCFKESDDEKGKNAENKGINFGNLKDIVFPTPAGPGSFWSVPDKNTGKSMIRVDGESGSVEGMYLGAPSSSVVAAYIAYLMERNLKTSEFDSFLEVHPSTDGIYSLIKYAASDEESNKS